MVTYLAFMSNRKPKNTRPDGNFETSINWEDDADAVALTRGDLANARYGVARVPTAELRHVMSRRHVRGFVSCERAPIADTNPYHGNLLFGAAMSVALERSVAESLALEAVFLGDQPRGGNRSS